MGRIAVLGGTSTAVLAHDFLPEASQLGNAIASTHVHMLTSCTARGVIGAFLDAQSGFQNARMAIVVSGSGKEQSIHTLVGSIVFVPSAPARKSLFLTQAQHIIALPCGLGTLDEIMTFLVERKSLPTSQRLILVNGNDFFSPSLALPSNMTSAGNSCRRRAPTRRSGPWPGALAGPSGGIVPSWVRRAGRAVDPAGPR